MKAGERGKIKSNAGSVNGASNAIVSERVAMPENTLADGRV